MAVGAVCGARFPLDRRAASRSGAGWAPSAPRCCGTSTAAGRWNPSRHQRQRARARRAWACPRPPSAACATWPISRSAARPPSARAPDHPRHRLGREEPMTTPPPPPLATMSPPASGPGRALRLRRAVHPQHAAARRAPAAPGASASCRRAAGRLGEHGRRRGARGRWPGRGLHQHRHRRRQCGRRDDRARTAGTPLLHITGPGGGAYWTITAPYVARVTGAAGHAAVGVRPRSGSGRPETALGTLAEAARVALTAPTRPVSISSPSTCRARRSRSTRCRPCRALYRRRPTRPASNARPAARRRAASAGWVAAPRGAYGHPAIAGAGLR